MALTDDLPKIFQAINTGLKAAYSPNQVKFTEDPIVNETSVIAVFNRWVPVTTDTTMVEGQLWILRGCASFSEAEAQKLILSSMVSEAAKGIQAQLNSSVPQYLKGFFAVVQNKDSTFNSWDLASSIRQEGALQKSPAIVQIRPTFKLEVPLSNTC